MIAFSMEEQRLKDVFKQALFEVLEERQDLVEALLVETLEDLGLLRAMQEGEKTEDVSREEVFEILEAAT